MPSARDGRGRANRGAKPRQRASTGTGFWRLPVSTDPSVHIAALNKLFDSGVTIVKRRSGQPNHQKVIEFYANNILPSFRNRS
jgi:hypothetical protein